MTSVHETAARAAAELRTVLASPHSEEFRRNALAGAKVAVARALVDAGLDPATTHSARRRFHATNPGFLARMAAFRELPDTDAELLATLDALAAQPVAA
jgi:hypothetical protein